MSENLFAEHLALYDAARHDFRIFMSGVVQYLGEHPELQNTTRAIVHSYKSRLKDREHLAAKLLRKLEKEETVEAKDLFSKITDLAGVRILHLYQEDFEQIDRVVRRKIADKDWHLHEKPKAYTWDPENVQFFERFDLEVSQKQTSYTSVHYLLRPRPESPICCELQVRTLFEEIWGK